VLPKNIIIHLLSYLFTLSRRKTLAWLLGSVLFAGFIGALFGLGTTYLYLLPRIHQIDSSILELESTLTKNEDRISNLDARLCMIEEHIENLSCGSSVEIPNPAAVFCLKCGGEYEIITNSDGSQYGVCIIEGREYDAWEYYREHCKEETK